MKAKRFLQCLSPITERPCKDKNNLANNVHVSRIIFAKVAFFCNKAILAWIFFIFYSD